MTQRAPRNIVSKTDVLSIRAAELLDDGMTDAQVAKALTAEFCGKPGSPVQVAVIKRETVMAFRHRDYAKIRQERQDRQELAKETRLVLSGSADAGVDFTKAGLSDMAAIYMRIAKLKKQSMESGEAIDLKDLADLGKSFAAVAKELKALGKQEAAAEIDAAVTGKKLTGAEVADEVRRIMGLKK